MTNLAKEETSQISPDVDIGRSRSQVVATQIERAIKSGRLPQGVVLTEYPIAKLFGCSRTPVRTALGELGKRGHLRRFDGRGFLVVGEGEMAPLRINLTHDMLGLSTDIVVATALLASERVAKEFESTLIHALPFGEFRINEQAAADYFQVSRTVIRDILSRLLVSGIVNKDPRSHWVIGPLTAAEVSQYYSIRARLEPLALEESVPLIDENMLEEMMNRLSEAQKSSAEISIELLAELEHDLHTKLLSKSNNPHLLRMVKQSQLALIVNHIFASFIGTQPFDDSLEEHALIFDFVKRGNYKLAAQALEEHLRQGADRTAKRLMAISVFPHPELEPYLKRVET